MAQKSTALLVRLNPETYKKFEQYRKAMAMNKTSFASLCITAGMEAVMRSVHPETAWPPGLVEEMAKGMVKAATPDVRKLIGRVARPKKKP